MCVTPPLRNKQAPESRLSAQRPPPPHPSPLYPRFLVSQTQRNSYSWFCICNPQVLAASVFACSVDVVRLCLWSHLWLFFSSLLRLQDFEAESGEPAMISALTPLFFPITPPFLLRDAAALRAHPSSSRAVNKPPLVTPPNMCELHLFLPFLLLSVQLCLEENVFPSCLTSCQQMWRLKRWITLRKIGLTQIMYGSFL